MLWLSLTARNAGQRTSELAGIEDEIAALEFDLACTHRVAIYDNEMRKAQANLIAHEVGKLLFGEQKTTTTHHGTRKRK